MTSKISIMCKNERALVRLDLVKYFCSTVDGYCTIEGLDNDYVVSEAKRSKVALNTGWGGQIRWTVRFNLTCVGICKWANISFGMGYYSIIGREQARFREIGITHISTDVERGFSTPETTGCSGVIAQTGGNQIIEHIWNCLIFLGYWICSWKWLGSLRQTAWVGVLEPIKTRFSARGELYSIKFKGLRRSP